MTIEEIYSKFSAGSEGFCIAVETHCGLEISRAEIERIADMADGPEGFMDIWENDDTWTDETAAKSLS